MVCELSWLEPGAKNTKAGGSLSLKLGLMVLVGPFQPRGFCDFQFSKAQAVANPKD